LIFVCVNEVKTPTIIDPKLEKTNQGCHKNFTLKNKITIKRIKKKKKAVFVTTIKNAVINSQECSYTSGTHQ